MRLDVSEEVYTEVERLCQMFGVSEDTLVRRLLKLPEKSAAASSGSKGSLPSVEAPTSSKSNQYWTRDGDRLAVGLELRKHFKGKEYRARVTHDGILVDGFSVYFTSPSLAAMAITNYNTNGWHFWEYKEPKTDTWHPLNKLRQ